MNRVLLVAGERSTSTLSLSSSSIGAGGTSSSVNLVTSGTAASVTLEAVTPIAVDGLTNDAFDAVGESSTFRKVVDADISSQQRDTSSLHSEPRSRSSCGRDRDVFATKVRAAFIPSSVRPVFESLHSIKYINILHSHRIIVAT